MNNPTLTIIAGVNNSGKTTFALGHYAVVWDEKAKKVKRIEAKDSPEYRYKI
jgi:predicted ABC-type ATPase